VPRHRARRRRARHPRGRRAHRRRGATPRATLPDRAEAVGHEIDWARAYPTPPLFVATARLDAVWAHDGILDVRDYKTGRVAPYPLHEDRGARLQAWVAASHATARGLRLRLRYEHLATEVLDDPDPWEPTDDELTAIEAELADAVTAMRAERDFHGVGDDIVWRVLLVSSDLRRERRARTVDLAGAAERRGCEPVQVASKHGPAYTGDRRCRPG